MRNTTCMTDYMEVEHGFEMFRSFLSTEEKRRAFTDALDICAPGAAMEAIGLFNQWWEQLRFNSYISSIAEHDDSEDMNGRLSMWRAFGGTSGRVALVLQVPLFPASTDQLNVLFSPVAYMNQDKVHATFHTVIENVRRHTELLRTLDRQTIVSWVFFMLMIGVVCVKHEGFLEEREWRAIYTPSVLLLPLWLFRPKWLMAYRKSSTICHLINPSHPHWNRSTWQRCLTDLLSALPFIHGQCARHS